MAAAAFYPRSLDAPPLFCVSEALGARVILSEQPGAGPARVILHVLEEDIVRVSILPGGAFSFPRTWAIAPGRSDVPSTGRDRLDAACDGFSCPAFAFHVYVVAGTLRLETSRLRLVAQLLGFRCSWEQRDARGVFLPIASDRHTFAYDWGFWGEGPRHYLTRQPGEAYYGLGECGGAMDRAGGLYRMRCSDAMGYDASSSDPLYKHLPFYATRAAAGGGFFGLYYDTLADCEFDFGREISNYHGPFRSFSAAAGDIDYYLIAGPALLALTRRFTWLTGRPALMPRWALGYSGSTMSYTDAPDAQARLGAFLAACAEHDVPCSSFHLSSGYTSRGTGRYVFEWNREKFPDPRAFVAGFAAAGVRLVANIKPALLRDHPLYASAAAAGLFIVDGASGAPALVQWWDGLGSLLDFTNEATQEWWRGRVKETLLEYGIAATWNDNNEYEGLSARSRASLFGASAPASSCKPLQTLLMMRASAAAQRAAIAREADAGAAASAEAAAAPLPRRPFLISRSGSAGMQRYVQTWSGDNLTAWATLRFNNLMGLGLALSGVSNAGHDVGGFAGPVPGPELLARWTAAAIFTPRFSIHSWKAGVVTEPWMYPSVLPAIRALLALRCTLAPLLYDLLWRYHARYEPVIAPVWALFPPLFLSPAASGDASGGGSGGASGWSGGAELAPALAPPPLADDTSGASAISLQECACGAQPCGCGDSMMLGPNLFVPIVVAPGAVTRRVCAPRIRGCDCAATGERAADGVASAPSAAHEHPPCYCWREFWSGAFIRCGAVVDLPAPLHRPPLLVREGSALPIDPGPHHWAGNSGAVAPHAHAAWLLFAPPRGAFTAEAFHDDGDGEGWRLPHARVMRSLTVEASSERLVLSSALSPLSPADARACGILSGAAGAVAASGGVQVDSFAVRAGAAAASFAPAAASVAATAAAGEAAAAPSLLVAPDLEIWLPASEARAVQLRGGSLLSDRVDAEVGRRILLFRAA